MTAWWYLLLFVTVTLLVAVGPYVCVLLEARADERDAEAWMQMPGATR